MARGKVEIIPHGSPSGIATSGPSINANQVTLIPAARGIVLNMPEQGHGGRMYTAAVFPLSSQPANLFNPDPFSGIVTQQNFGMRHRAEILYGTGGGGSESVFVDIKRGFKLAIPCSALRITAYNVYPQGTPVNDDTTIQIGASLAEGGSSESDGLTLTVATNQGGSTPFLIPPHAKSADIYVGPRMDLDLQGNVFDTLVHMRQASALAAEDYFISYFRVPNGDRQPIHVDLPGNITILQVSVDSGVIGGNFDITVVFNIAL